MALESFSDILNMSAYDSSIPRITEGDEFYSEGHYQRALEAYQKVPSENGSVRFAVLFRMGWCWYLLHDITKAERCWTEAHQLNPENPLVVLSLAIADFSKAKLSGSLNFDETLARLNQLELLLRADEEKQEIMPQCLLLKLRVYIELANLKDAKQVLDYVLARYPNHIASQKALAHFLMLQENFEEAYEAYMKILLSDPLQPSAYEGIAKCALKLKKEKEAIQTLVYILNFYPHLHLVHYWLGWLHYKTRNYRDARISLERSVELCPTNPYAHYYLGSALLWIFSPRAARRHFDECARLLLSYTSKPSLDYCYSLRGLSIAEFMCLNWIRGIKLVLKSLSMMQKIFLSRLEDRGSVEN